MGKSALPEGSMEKVLAKLSKKRGRKFSDFHNRPAAGHHNPLHTVAQLPYVARPIIAQHLLKNPVGEHFYPVIFLAVLLQKNAGRGG